MGGGLSRSHMVSQRKVPVVKTDGRDFQKAEKIIWTHVLWLCQT